MCGWKSAHVLAPGDDGVLAQVIAHLSIFQIVSYVAALIFTWNLHNLSYGYALLDPVAVFEWPLSFYKTLFLPQLTFFKQTTYITCIVYGEKKKTIWKRKVYVLGLGRIWYFLPDIRCLPDNPTKFKIRPDNLAGYTAKWKIRPDNPALPDIRPNPSRDPYV